MRVTVDVSFWIAVLSLLQAYLSLSMGVAVPVLFEVNVLFFNWGDWQSVVGGTVALIGVLVSGFIFLIYSVLLFLLVLDSCAYFCHVNFQSLVCNLWAKANAFTCSYRKSPTADFFTVTDSGVRCSYCSA